MTQVLTRLRRRWLTAALGALLSLWGVACVPGQQADKQAVTPAPWSATGPLHTARSYHTATLLRDGRVLVAGGYVPPKMTATAEIYDHRTGSWQETGSMHVARSAHTASLLADGRVLVTGGVKDLYVVTDTAEIYDPAAGTWKLAPPMQVPRVSHKATSLPDGTILVAGGVTSYTGTVAVALTQEMTPNSETFDPKSETWTQAGPMRSARNDYSSVALGGSRPGVLAVGGFMPSQPGTPPRATATAEIYNTTSRTWAETGAMGQVRGDFGLAMLAGGNQIIAAGGTFFGANKFGQTAKVDSYDVALGKWRPATPMTIPRSEHKVVALRDGKVLVIAGTAGREGGRLKSAEIYDPGARTWKSAGNTNVVRMGHTATLLSDGWVLVAGGQPEDLGPSTASADLYKGP